MESAQEGAPRRRPRRYATWIASVKGLVAGCVNLALALAMGDRHAYFRGPFFAALLGVVAARVSYARLLAPGAGAGGDLDDLVAARGRTSVLLDVLSDCFAALQGAYVGEALRGAARAAPRSASPTYAPCSAAKQSERTSSSTDVRPRAATRSSRSPPAPAPGASSRA